jgi:hypothetical protein
LGAALRFEDVDVLGKLRGKLACHRLCFGPVLLQSIEVDQLAPGYGIIWGGGTRPVDVVHRLRPFLLRDGNVREPQQGNDIV